MDEFGNIHILGIDPGSTTGIAYITRGPGGYMEAMTGQCPPDEVLRSLDQTPPALIAHLEAVAIERYVITRRSMYGGPASTDPLNVIGVVQEWATQHNIPVVLQPPSDVKNLITDDVLKYFLLWIKARPHARDAIRHALYWLVVNKYVTMPRPSDIMR